MHALPAAVPSHRRHRHTGDLVATRTADEAAPSFATSAVATRNDAERARLDADLLARMAARP